MSKDPRDARLIKRKDTLYILSYSKLLMLRRMRFNPNQSLVEYIGEHTPRNGRRHAIALIKHGLVKRTVVSPRTNNYLTYSAEPFEEIEIIGVPGNINTTAAFLHEDKKLLRISDQYAYVSPIAYQFLQDASHSKLRTYCGDEDSMVSRTRRILKEYGVLEQNGRLTKHFEIIGHTLVL